MSGDDRREPDLQAAAAAADPRPRAGGLSPTGPPLEMLADLFRDHHDRVFRTAYRVTGDVVMGGSNGTFIAPPPYAQPGTVFGALPQGSYLQTTAW